MSLVRSIGGRLLLLALALSGLLGVRWPITASAMTAASTTRYSYDAPQVTRVGVAPVRAVASASSLFSDMREESASPPTSARATSTIPHPRGVATNTVDDILPMPGVSNTKLQNIVNDLYKGTTNPGRVGTGTTADAVRNELATGLPTGGKFHSEKAQIYINGLNNVLKQDLTASDRLVAQSLLDDLVDALRGAS